MFMWLVARMVNAMVASSSPVRGLGTLQDLPPMIFLTLHDEEQLQPNVALCSLTIVEGILSFG